MKTVRKRKVCRINGMKYNAELKIIIAKHNDGTENHFCLSDNRSHTKRNEEFKMTIRLAKEMRGN